MNYSASMLGRLFHVNGQEMNVVLRNLDYLHGAPGNYGLTEKGLQYGSVKLHDNGYGGYCHRGWDTISFDESIVESLKQEVNPEVIKVARAQLSEHRATQKAARLAEQKAFEEMLLRKQEMKNAAIAAAQRHHNQLKTAGIVSLVVIGIAMVGTCIYFGVSAANKKKAKLQREQQENEQKKGKTMNNGPSDLNKPDTIREETADTPVS